MKKWITKAAVLSVFAMVALSASADCVDALDACYSEGGSEKMCNKIYTACLK